MNNDEKESLYLNLPSIKNRVSRKERISLQRKGECTDCLPDRLVALKRRSKHMYRFFLALVFIFFLVAQVYQRRVDVDSFSKESSKTIKVSFTKKITMTIVDTPSRYGISVVFRNTGSQKWDISTVKIDIPNSSDNKDIPINQVLSKDDFYSVFIPLTQKVDKINDITITTL